MTNESPRSDRRRACRRTARFAVIFGWSFIFATGCSGADQDGGGKDASIDPITGEGGSRPPPAKDDAGPSGSGKPDRGKLDVEGEFNLCPSATVLVIPPEVQLGTSATLIAEVVDPDSSSLSYTWWISEGSTSEVDQPRTTYQCTSSGEKQLRLTVYDGTCGDTVETTVSCVDGR